MSERGSDAGDENGEGRLGAVVVYASDTRDFAATHEKTTRTELARRLAVLKGFRFAGEYDPLARYPGPLYFAPGNTIVGLDAARHLGILREEDLFGGVVPAGFVATKAITHGLVDSSAPAPATWSHDFGARVGEAVLSGFSAFTREDARRAGEQLLERGPARVKPVSATGGRGQIVVFSRAELEAALDAAAPADIAGEGLVLEEDLVDVTTFSVGQVRVAGLTASYYGTQHLTSDNAGEAVYGGSSLVVARGGFEALLTLSLSEEARLAVAQARLYDAAALECFPGLFASRRNYDVARGFDAAGRPRSGVLEQSWRIGGASGAEVAALEAFAADPELKVARASTVEVYGGREPPADATLYFSGVDERVGPICKYARIDGHGDA